MAAEVLRFDMGPVREVLGSAFTTAKEWTKWLSHKITVISRKAWDVTKVGIQKLAQLLAQVWKGCLPYILQVGAFLASKPGIFGITVLAAFVFLRMALSDDNITSKTGRYALGTISLMVAFFSGSFGTQAGIVPQFIAGKV